MVRVKVEEDKLVNTLLKIHEVSEGNVEITIMKGKESVGEARLKGDSILLAFYSESPYIPEEVVLYIPKNEVVDAELIAELPFLIPNTIENVKEEERGDIIIVKFNATTREISGVSEFFPDEKPEVEVVLKRSSKTFGNHEELFIESIKIKGAKKEVKFQMSEHKL
ncbi:hypothetical protein Py04_1059 [Pyrococcus sp. ST04]|nr:hypothetical protein Py04_1059 [Pyrococcus sp. ST04]